jgi:hypothetical protein
MDPAIAHHIEKPENNIHETARRVLRPYTSLSLVKPTAKPVQKLLALTMAIDEDVHSLIYVKR